MTKVKVVLDATAKSHLPANSINKCIYKGSQQQPLLWDNLITERMSTHLVLKIVDIQKEFLQTGVREEDRDAFWFQFNINGKEHCKVYDRPHSSESSPFLPGATLNYH